MTTLVACIPWRPHSQHSPSLADARRVCVAGGMTYASVSGSVSSGLLMVMVIIMVMIMVIVMVMVMAEVEVK